VFAGGSCESDAAVNTLFADDQAWPTFWPLPKNNPALLNVNKRNQQAAFDQILAGFVN